MNQTILFLCPHGAAKSVIAAAYFNRLAQQHNLPFSADAAGTEPDEVVSPAAVVLLKQDGFDISQHQPRRVTALDLQTASRVFSMGCTPDELGVETERVEIWHDVPAVSQQPEQARRVILNHIEHLIAQLQTTL